MKYHSKEDLDHVMNTFKENYDISIDKEGHNYCGLSIDWNYQQGYVDISIPTYVYKALRIFAHPAPLRSQHAPHCWTQLAYGQKIQYATPTHTHDKLDLSGKDGYRQ